MFLKCQILYQPSNTLQILNWIHYNVSDFKPTTRKCIKFWLEDLTTRQTLDWKNFQRLIFWTKNFLSCQILRKRLQSKYHNLFQFNPWKRHLMQFLCWFEKHEFELEFSLLVRFQIEKEVPLVRVQNKKNTTRQISS